VTTADIILKNASVITMDESLPAAEMVAVKGDRILFVGKSGDAEILAGVGTKVIDCGGKTVLPGFNDAHCHIISLVRKLFSIDLSPKSVKSILDMKDAIRRRASDTPPGEWLFGTDYNEFYLAEKRHPTRWELDEASPAHPVVLSHRSLHACVLNSLALSRADINRETPEPSGGLIERDLATGEPNGILYDMLGYVREKVIPPLGEGRIAEGMAEAGRYYLSCGITSLQEATVSNDYSRWQSFRALREKGELPLRMSMMLGAANLEWFEDAGLKTGDGDDWLRLGGVKVIIGETSGHLYPPQEDLNRIALESHRAGFQLAFHAIEESTVEAVIIALEYVSRQSPITGRRHRIEHCSECPPHLLKRLSRLGVVVVTQPPFIYYSGERYLATVAPSQLPWLYRMKSWFDSGLVVAGSSDSPIVPANPLAGIYAAVTRKAESGQLLLPEERISVRQALKMYTINAARASFEEKLKGSIMPGKLADIVVLSDNPERVPEEGIKDIKAVMTMVGGRVVWED